MRKFPATLFAMPRSPRWPVYAKKSRLDVIRGERRLAEKERQLAEAERRLEKLQRRRREIYGKYIGHVVLH